LRAAEAVLGSLSDSRSPPSPLFLFFVFGFSRFMLKIQTFHWHQLMKKGFFFFLQSNGTVT